MEVKLRLAVHLEERMCFLLLLKKAHEPGLMVQAINLSTQKAGAELISVDSRLA